MRRILVFNRLGTALGEIDPNDVLEATMREEINGEHSLEIVTTQVLEKGTRLLHEDGRGRWREFAVAGVDAEHAAGVTAVGTYYCPWSIQEDLMGVSVSVMPGVQTPVTASTALTSMLSSQARWTVGTVTNTATGGASMYDRSAWEALSTLIDVWGGEIDVTIGISTVTGVITRAVDLYAKQGDQSAKRRFDFGADVTGIIRTLPDEPLYCRISPRGKGEETDAGGYGRKITIESVNDGKDYLEYAPMVDAAKLPNGSSGYTYPTKIVENGDIETPAELKTWAQSILEAECTPDIGYEINVLQSDEAGTSVQGVSLGDAVHVVDGSFGGGGLRVEARVTSITTDLVGERVDTVELGMTQETISSKFEKVSRSMSMISNQMSVMSTAEYISELLERINAEANATGGYTYITEGQGLRTYDVAVSDPLVGSEASMVVEIKGGNIRIANSKTAQGAWNWKTVLQSGHILASLITAANLTAGYIGSANSGNYWDLDSGTLTVNGGSIHGGTLVMGGANNTNGVIKVVDASNNTVCLLNNAGIEASGTLKMILAGFISAGKVYGELASFTIPNLVFNSYPNDARGLQVYSSGNSYNSRVRLGVLKSGKQAAGSTNATAALVADHPLAICGMNSNSSVQCDMEFSAEASYSNGEVKIRAGTFYTSDGTFAGFSVHVLKTSVQFMYQSVSSTITRPLYVSTNGISVSGTKSRLVDTDHYANRLLYCYETPSPMFGDIGSGVIDDDGYCFVSVDDIFAETARADLAYQVFLQKCGQGDLWVESKDMTHFVVRGTPGLSFDWELKAHQTGFEHLRLEQFGMDETELAESGMPPSPDEAYQDYVEEIEQALYA